MLVKKPLLKRSPGGEKKRWATNNKMELNW